MFRESLAPGSTHAFAFSSHLVRIRADIEGIERSNIGSATVGRAPSGGSDPDDPLILRSEPKPLWIRPDARRQRVHVVVLPTTA